MKKSPYKQKYYERDGVHEESRVNLISNPGSGMEKSFIICCGETRLDGNSRMPLKGSQCYYSLEFFTGGSGILECDGKKVPVKAGDVFLYKENPPRVLVNPNAAPVTKKYLSVMVSREFMSLFPFFDERSRLVHLRGQARMEELFARVREVVSGTSDYLFDELSGLFYLCLLELSKAAEKTESVSMLAERILFFPQLYPDVESLMRELKLTRHGLYSLFKKKFNTTPMDYLIRRRLANARWHLENENIPVSEIGRLCGYRSIQFFSREFKKAFGVPPMVYRRELVSGTRKPITR